MADKFITELTENTAPLGSDLDVLEDDPAGTPLTQKIYKGSNNLMFDGFILNGKISVTVASNNITVAIKTKSGGNPSTTDPVSVWINGSYRRITAALSVTKNAGTNWFNSGSSELATLEVDYFVYLIWNTTPATDIMDIGFARIPSGRVYSDFSGTTTNGKYLAFGNASTPTSTDDCVVIGRFAATLSAGAGYTWTVPTFTNENLINQPILVTRWLSWTPVHTGFSTAPTGGATRYQLNYKTMQINYSPVTVGASNATGYTITAPFIAKNISNYYQYFSTGWTYDNSANVANGIAYATPNSNVITVTKSALGTWTGSNNKIANFTLLVEIE